MAPILPRARSTTAWLLALWHGRETVRGDVERGVKPGNWKRRIKDWLNDWLGVLGLQLERNVKDSPIPPGSAARPIAEQRSFLADIAARGFVPQGIVDVGANKGRWTEMALSIFPDAAYILIEPQDEMVERLQALCQTTSNVAFVKAGVAAEAGERIQTIWPDLAGSSFLPGADETMLANAQQRRCRMVTLDEVLVAYPTVSPDLVKLDIQGFELEALKGAQTLFGVTELFIVEVSLYSFLPDQPVVGDVVTFMRERSYELYDVAGFIRRPLDGALGQLDLAFVKRDGCLRHDQRWDY